MQLKTLLFSILLFAGLFYRCANDDLTPLGAFPITSGFEGAYKGIVTVKQIKFPHSVLDTLPVEFTIGDSTFQHGQCTGSFFEKNDSLVFESNECLCWCESGCLKFIETIACPDCECWCSWGNPMMFDCNEENGDLMLGKRAFQISGDSLYMWNTRGFTEVDSATGINWGSHADYYFSLKKVE
jgi:hypothetical protein